MTFYSAAQDRWPGRPRPIVARMHDEGSARPGAVAGAVHRIENVLSPHVEVTPAPEQYRVDWDVPVVVRDGTTLRVNVFHPGGDCPVPVIMSAHPYGKDKIPARTRSGHELNFQYHIFPQPEPVRISAWANWEAPDPAFWLPRGFAVVNADMRGAGTSDGVGDLLSDQEARDYYDLIEWAGTQPWCNGKVGLDGVPTWRSASTGWRRCGRRTWRRSARGRGSATFTVTSPGPAGSVRKAFPLSGRRRREGGPAPRRPARGARQARRARRVVRGGGTPAGGHRGAHAGLRLVLRSLAAHPRLVRGLPPGRSARKWLYTHRDGKWSHYYGETAAATRARFFEHFLLGADNGWADEPPVRLAVHEAGRPPQRSPVRHSGPRRTCGGPRSRWTSPKSAAARQRERARRVLRPVRGRARHGQPVVGGTARHGRHRPDGAARVRRA